jgi:hypothetical protein
MLIASKFRDYYDTASAYGIDKTCVYVRDEKTLDVQGNHWQSEPYLLVDSNRIPLGKLPSPDTKRTAYYDYEFHKIVVGFCGELYPLIKVTKKGRITRDIHTFCFYEHAELREFLAEEGIEEKKYGRYSWYADKFSVDSDQGMHNFFEPSTWKKLEVLFHTFRVPCFDVSWKRVTLNPCLKDKRFMVVKDPQSAFQDVYMYLSGVLGAPPPPKEKISDEIMAASKGHDGEYSFRKPPGKRGKKQWR